MAFAAVGFNDKSNDVRMAASNLFETAMKMERMIDMNSIIIALVVRQTHVTREDALKAIEKLPHGLCSAIDERMPNSFLLLPVMLAHRAQ